MVRILICMDIRLFNEKTARFIYDFELFATILAKMVESNVVMHIACLEPVECRVKNTDKYGALWVKTDTKGSINDFLIDQTLYIFNTLDWNEFSVLKQEY